ncbi:dihydroneopterin aldolase [Acetivibrio clariflavus]|uniref:dihydroneopterin aldolase n=1 Tax=Acetivibrio clariflavus TaxID=288965 RepID=UPI00048029CF|nr:dihydroneopterin aldolase [Acetivibrio clariflavus]
MDKILLKDIKLYGYHGVLEKEREIGQYFYIDIEIFLDLEPAGITDDLGNTVDYSVVYDIIKDINNKNKFRLIESFAQKISEGLMSNFDKIKTVVVKIRKPDAPIDGDFGWVGVEIKRSRENA